MRDGWWGVCMCVVVGGGERSSILILTTLGLSKLLPWRSIIVHFTLFCT